MKKSHPTVGLRDGDPIPVIGLGVYQTAPGEETQRAVLDALAAGYRHIDTARIYENEKDVSIALKKSELPRQEVFITTKVWNTDHGYDKTLKACDASLKRLGLDYLDLYLVHWPVPKLRKDTWRAMIELKKSGKTRAIGVSNYYAKHLTEMLDAAVVPEVNQIELHPFLYPKDLTDLCTEHGIVVEAYSPLTRGERIDHPAITKVATKVGKTNAQVLVRWGIQHGWVTLPKSKQKARIVENADVFDFEISSEDMRDLDGLNENLHTSWDPTEAP